MTGEARLLLPLTYGFSVRYAVPTGLVERLAEFCQPVVALGWDDPELVERLERIGAQVLRLPDANLTHDYRMYRRRLGLIRDRRLGGPTPAIRRRRQRVASGSLRAATTAELRRYRDTAALLVPGATRRAEAAESVQVESGSNVGDFHRFVERHRIDAVLSLTPYHDQDMLALWAARAAGCRTILSIISFDNPTTRERLAVRGDLVLVWNRHNAQELLRSYPDLRADRVSVVGAPQFDLHRRADLLWDRSTWCDHLQLPQDRPVVLFGAVPSQLVRGQTALVRALDAAVERARLPGDPLILVRRHPVDPAGPWTALGRELRHVTVSEPWGGNSGGHQGWPRREDLTLQMSSLAHAEVHVNVCSSMTLDGAVFDRPQVGPSFVPGAPHSVQRYVRDLYAQEHWQAIAASGGLAMARDEDALIAAVRRGLEDRGDRRAGRQRMLADVLTYIDGQSTERVASAVAAELER
jgi:hypothetical protein